MIRRSCFATPPVPRVGVYHTHTHGHNESDSHTHIHSESDSHTHTDTDTHLSCNSRVGMCYYQSLPLFAKQFCVLLAIHPLQFERNVEHSVPESFLSYCEDVIHLKRAR